MPAANIMEIQLEVRKVGFSPSPPSRTLPNLLSASHSTKATKAVAASTNTQPTLSTVQPKAASAAVWNDSVNTNPQRSTRAIRMSAGMKTPMLILLPGGSPANLGFPVAFSSLMVTVPAVAR